jgi:hypothetical protein
MKKYLELNYRNPVFFRYYNWQLITKRSLYDYSVDQHVADRIFKENTYGT